MLKSYTVFSLRAGSTRAINGTLLYRRNVKNVCSFGRELTNISQERAKVGGNGQKSSRRAGAACTDLVCMSVCHVMPAGLFDGPVPIKAISSWVCSYCLKKKQKKKLSLTAKKVNPILT